MVNPVYTLALRALQTHKSVATHLTRIQHGFMLDKNIDEAQAVIADLQKMLCDMQKALKDPPSNPPIVPLK